jgi:hypothetical protein
MALFLRAAVTALVLLVLLQMLACVQAGKMWDKLIKIKTKAGDVGVNAISAYDAGKKVELLYAITAGFMDAFKEEPAYGNPLVKPAAGIGSILQTAGKGCSPEPDPLIPKVIYDPATEWNTYYAEQCVTSRDTFICDMLDKADIKIQVVHSLHLTINKFSAGLGQCGLKGVALWIDIGSTLSLLWGVRGGSVGCS